MKVILINTSFLEKEMDGFTKLNPPLGLLYIAAPLIREGFQVELIDPQIETDYMKKIENAMAVPPLFVGMTTFMGTNILNALKISQYIKKISPHTPIVWGGPMATSSPELCLQSCPVDHIAMGMGEKTVVSIANALGKNANPADIPHVSSFNNGKITIKDVYYFTGDLDTLDYPKFQLWNHGIREMGYIFILSSRGCPRNCAFCFHNSFSGRKKWYSRSTQNVLDEMEFWADYYKMNKFHFIDDNFLINTKRACSILEKSIERNYEISQVAGNLYDFNPQVLKYIYGYIDLVSFGIESASLKIQKLLNKVIELDRVLELIKELTKNEIKTIATNFMFGLPTETDEDISASIQLAIKIRNINSSSRMIPYIYTPQPKDDIIPKFDFSKKINFSIENLSSIDLSGNRSDTLSHELRPWMSKQDTQFYLDLSRVWFYQFDPVVRQSQDINIDSIYKRNDRLYKLFKNVPLPT